MKHDLCVREPVSLGERKNEGDINSLIEMLANENDIKSKPACCLILAIIHNAHSSTLIIILSGPL